MGKLKGRVALITGGANGMGASHARLCAQNGAAVIIADVSEQGQAVAAAIGDRALFVRLDVTDAASWNQAVEAGEARFGPIDILVNNAGAHVAGSFAEAEEADFQRLIAVNQMGVFLGMQAVVGTMRRAGRGSIINIASTAALYGVKKAPIYAATKWAVRGLTLSAVSEFAAMGVRVNMIMPGPIAGTVMMGENDPAYVEEMRQRVPMQRLGEVEDVSNVVVFLASDDAGFVTGAQITVDGGISS